MFVIPYLRIYIRRHFQNFDALQIHLLPPTAMCRARGWSAPTHALGDISSAEVRRQDDACFLTVLRAGADQPRVVQVSSKEKSSPGLSYSSIERVKIFKYNNENVM